MTKEKYLKENGVTLVALIVTITVLLILAGITITTLFGESNVVSKATDSQIQTQLSELQEGLEKFKITSEEGTVKEGDFSSRISNKYLKDHKIIQEVETKEGIKLGIIQDFKTININTKFGQKGKEIDGNWNEKMSDLYDVFAIDMLDNTIYYIKNENVWSTSGTIEIADIVDKIEIKKSPKMKMSPSEGVGISNETTVTITAKAEDGKTLNEDNIYEYYISKSSNALIGGGWRTFENDEPFNLELKQNNISYYIFVKRVEDSQKMRTTGNDTIISGIPYHKFGPFRSSGAIVENYRITYELDGGRADNPLGYKIDTETFTLNNPIKIGYTFIGWTGTNGTTPEKEVKIEKGSSGFKTYRANYRANTYTIEYDANGAEGKTEKSVHTYDIEKRLTENGFGNLGYTFKGWSLNKEDQIPIFLNTDSIKNITGEDGAVVKLYAVWKDETKPTIKVEPESAIVAKNTNIEVTVEEIGGSGLNKDNRYEYQLGTSNTVAPTGTWTAYTSGTSNTIGTDLTGTYYLWIKEIKDNSLNISVAGGTKVGAYHVYGTYVFDNSVPNITFTPNTNTTYAKSQLAKVDVQDNGTSGVATASLKYQWTQNTSAPTEASFTTTFTNGGNVSKADGTGNNWYLWILAKDNLGNTTIKNSGVFYLDNTNPTNTAPTGVVTSNTITVAFKQTDLNSGINAASKQYAIKKTADTAWGAYVTDSALVHTFTNLTKNTEYQIKTKVTDNAGNTLESAVTTIKTDELDRPVLSQTPTAYTNGNVTVTISYPDLSYATKQYSYDGTNWTDATVNPTKLTITENKTIYARIIDSTNQVSGTATLSVTNIDKVAPTAPILTNTSNGNWTNQDVTITVKSIDSASGIDHYEWFESGSWVSRLLITTSGVGTITYTENRNESVRFRAVDKVGNISPESTTSVKIDKIPPVVGTGTITPTTTNLTLAITGQSDSLSDIKEYEFYLDGVKKIAQAGASYTYTGLTPNKQYTLKYVVRDNAGNIVTSSDMQKYTLANVPTSLVATGGSAAEGQQITVNWAANGNNGTLTYELESSIDGTTYTNVYTGTALTYTNTGVLIGNNNGGTVAQRTYRIRAKNGEGTYTAYTTGVKGNTLASPVVTQTITSNGINTRTNNISLNWSAVTGASGYGLIVFDGKAYRSYDIGNITSWNTNTAKIYPTDAQITAWNGTTDPFRWAGDGGAWKASSNEMYTKAASSYTGYSYYIWLHVYALDSGGRVSGSTWSGATSKGGETLDTDAPNNFTPTATSATNSITLTGSTTDKYMTVSGPGSGIRGYTFSKDNGATWTAEQAATSYTYNGLTHNTSYTLKMRAYDNKGNYVETVAISKATTQLIAGTLTMKLGSSSGTAFSSGGWANQNVYVTLNNGNGTTTYESIAGSSQTVAVGTTGITIISTEGTTTLRVKTTDGINTVYSGNYVINVDKTLPVWNIKVTSIK